MMNKRPGTVTFIAWFSIIYNIFALILINWLANNFITKIGMDLALSRNPMPLQIQYWSIDLYILSSIGCAMGMLMGNNWARLIYTGLSMLWVLTSFLFPSSQSQSVPIAIVTSIIIFLLYRPNATRYFTQSIL